MCDRWEYDHLTGDGSAVLTDHPPPKPRPVPPGWHACSRCGYRAAGVVAMWAHKARCRPRRP